MIVWIEWIPTCFKIFKNIFQDTLENEIYDDGYVCEHLEKVKRNLELANL